MKLNWNKFYKLKESKNIEKDLQIATLYKDGVLSLETTHKEMELVDDVEDEAKKLKDEKTENIIT